MATLEATIEAKPAPARRVTVWFTTEIALYDDARIQGPVWLLGVLAPDAFRLMTRLYEGNGPDEYADILGRALNEWDQQPTLLRVDDPRVFEEVAQALALTHALRRLVHGARLGPDGDLATLNQTLS